MADEKKEDQEPYRPEHTGLDMELAERADATVERAREGAAARGEAASWDWVEEGPGEAAERLGTSREEVEESIERARRRREPSA